MGQRHQAGTAIIPLRRTGILRKRLSSGKRSWMIVVSPQIIFHGDRQIIGRHVCIRFRGWPCWGRAGECCKRENGWLDRPGMGGAQAARTSKINGSSEDYFITLTISSVRNGLV